MNSGNSTTKTLKTRTVLPFTIITFAITWGIASLFLFFYEPVEAIFGEIGYTNPLYILAVYAPAISAVILVWFHHGFSGLIKYLRRLTLWRMPFLWWLFLIFGVPFLFYLAAFIQGTYGEAFPFSPWETSFSALLIMLLLGPVEEFGWRGFMLPLMQRRFSPLSASLIIGIIWGVWHFPTFIIGGTPHSEWIFVEFFIGAVALSVIMTAMFNVTKGSILMLALLHFQLNNPIWPDAQRWVTILFALAALVVIYIYRESMLRGSDAVVDVLLPDKKDATDP